MKQETTIFGEMMRVRAPVDLIDAIDRVAGRNLLSRSGYVRSAVLEKLRADGVTLKETQTT